MDDIRTTGVATGTDLDDFMRSADYACAPDKDLKDIIEDKLNEPTVDVDPSESVAALGQQKPDYRADPEPKNRLLGCDRMRKYLGDSDFFNLRRYPSLQDKSTTPKKSNDEYINLLKEIFDNIHSEADVLRNMGNELYGIDLTDGVIDQKKISLDDKPKDKVRIEVGEVMIIKDLKIIRE